MFSLEGSDQALSGGGARLVGVQESAACIADDDDGSGTQWDNFQVIVGGWGVGCAGFLFIQEPGADNRAVMIAS